MANIRVDVNGELTDGMTVTFKAPCDCSEIQGLVIYYNKNGEQHFENFTMKDSLVQNLSNVNNLFTAGAYVTVVLDTENKRAFLQNAATSGYLEERVAPVDNLESDRSDLPLSARMGSELNKNMGGLRFGIDGDGNYGYYGADDSLIPFRRIRVINVVAGHSAVSSATTANASKTITDAKKGDILKISRAYMVANGNLKFTVTFSGGVSHTFTETGGQSPPLYDELEVTSDEDIVVTVACASTTNRCLIACLVAY